MEKYITHKNPFFFNQTLFTYTDKLLREDGFNKIVKQIFKDKVVNDIYSIKHEFVTFLAELLHLIKKTKKDQIEFFQKYEDYLRQIDDKVFAKDFADGFLLNLPSADKYDRLIKDAFTKKD